MKIRKMVRWQLILAGLAAALYFAPAAYSQEITNTDFADGPNVIAFTQPAATQPSAQAATQTVSPAANEPMPAQASLSTPTVISLNSPWAAAGMTLVLFAAIALAAGMSNRGRRGAYSGRRYPSYRGA